MTFFGILWCSIVIICFLNKNIKYMYAITLLFMTFQCAAVFFIGPLAVGPQILTSMAFVTKSILQFRGKIHFKRKVNLCKKKNIHMPYLCILLLAFVIFYSSYINNSFNYRILRILQLYIYMLCFVCISISTKNMELDEIYSVVKKIIIFVMIIGIMQFLTTIGLVSLRPILEALIYNEHASSSYFMIKTYNSRIYSTFMEPSYYSGFLVGAIYYLLSFKDKWKENIWIIVILILELLVSRSSTGYGAFLIIGIIYIFSAKELDLLWKFTISGIALICFIFFFVNFYELLDDVIFSKRFSGSGITRTYVNKRALERFLESPVWGIGYKNVRASSIIPSLLGELGTVGTCIYLLLNIKMVFPVLKKNKLKLMYFSPALSLLAVVVCQILACPDLDLCTYWFWMYVFSSYIAINKNKIEKI